MVSHGLYNYDNHSHQLDYDHLVLALGSITNFFNLPGFAELALAMKSLPDASGQQALAGMAKANDRQTPTLISPHKEVSHIASEPPLSGRPE